MTEGNRQGLQVLVLWRKHELTLGYLQGRVNRLHMNNGVYIIVTSPTHQDVSLITAKTRFACEATESKPCCSLAQERPVDCDIHCDL